MNRNQFDLEEQDFGRTPASLKNTLRTSMKRSKIEDPPLPPMRGIKRHLPRYWLCRLYLATSLLLAFYSVYLLPDSVLGRILAGSRTGWFLVDAVCFLSALIIIDVLVELAPSPAPRSIRLLHDHRHVLLNAIALGILGLGYTIVKTSGWSPVLLNFADDLAIALTIAPLDMYARHREK